MKILLALVVIIVVIVAATLLKNNAKLFDPPGFSKRLVVYLTTNTAHTADDHIFPELRTPVFNTGPDELYLAVQSSAIELGWPIEDSNDVEWTMRLMVRTPVLLFRDDITLQIIPNVDLSTSALEIKSHSRVGGADFAANAGHIQQLISTVNERYEQVQIE